MGYISPMSSSPSWTYGNSVYGTPWPIGTANQFGSPNQLSSSPAQSSLGTASPTLSPFRVLSPYTSPPLSPYGYTDAQSRHFNDPYDINIVKRNPDNVMVNPQNGGNLVIGGPSYSYMMANGMLYPNVMTYDQMPAEMVDRPNVEVGSEMYNEFKREGRLVEDNGMVSIDGQPGQYVVNGLKTYIYPAMSTIASPMSYSSPARSPMSYQMSPARSPQQMQTPGAPVANRRGVNSLTSPTRVTVTPFPSASAAMSPMSGRMASPAMNSPLMSSPMMSSPMMSSPQRLNFASTPESGYASYQSPYNTSPPITAINSFSGPVLTPIQSVGSSPRSPQ